MKQNVCLWLAFVAGLLGLFTEIGGPVILPADQDGIARAVFENPAQ